MALRSLPTPAAGETEDRPPVESLPIVRAESIELVDRGGVMRAWLGPLDDGAVVFAMRDQTGTIRVVLIADATDANVALSNSQGRVVWQAP